MQTARVMITGGHGTDTSILEISSDGILEVTVGNLSIQKKDETLDSNQHFTEDAKRKRKNISKKDREILDELITNVKENCNAEDEVYGEDFTFVYAFIDNVSYTSYYHGEDYRYQNHINEELRTLAHKLVELSPIKLDISGEYVGDVTKKLPVYFRDFFRMNNTQRRWVLSAILPINLLWISFIIMFVIVIAVVGLVVLLLLTKVRK